MKLQKYKNYLKIFIHRILLVVIAVIASLALMYQPRVNAISPSKIKQGTQVQSPYEDVEWKEVKHVPSVSHYHCRTQGRLDVGYDGGIRHFAISNYYPSAPCSPEEKVHQYFVAQNHPILHNGKFTSGTLNWNEIIMDPKTGWIKELPKKLQAKFPYTMGAPIFPRLQKDVIISPNAEHHSLLNISGRIHINSLGSRFTSGNFDVGGQHQLPKHGYPIGANLTWQDTFRKILNQLAFKDGGGIIINHPRWAGLKHDMLCNMLDFDKQRVLGIEVFNHTAEVTRKTGWSIEEWDAILATGRRCFGFFVPDHSHERKEPFLGRNILLVNNMTESECLRAYRQGQFYGALKGSGLRFESLTVSNGILSAKTNIVANIKFIGKNRILKTVKSNVGSIAIPKSGSQFIRVEASDDKGEVIFSQPFMITLK